MLTTPRKKHSHRCPTCRHGVYCYKTQCQIPQRSECANCLWITENKRKQAIVRITFYFAGTGREQSSHDCDSYEEAFERLTQTNMDAIAIRPHAGTHGCYIWRPDGENTLDALKAKLEATR